MELGSSLIDIRELRFRIDELFADYTDCIDERELSRWPDFFTEDCLYKVISRENFEQNLPLATMFCEGRAGLIDRVNAIRDTAVYQDRWIRHLISTVKLLEVSDEAFEARTNFAVFETLPGQHTRVFMTGAYCDRIVSRKGHLKFHRKLCVYDSALIPASLIYPV